MSVTVVNAQGIVTKKKARRSNLELLRIVSMLLIVAFHYSINGAWVMGNEMTINRAIINFLSVGGKIGVNCFVLITGYFMIYSKFKGIKLLKLAGQVVFYSLGILIVFKLLHLTNVGFRGFIKSSFPIIFEQYWFATTYVLLYIISPYLNSYISHTTREEHQNILVVLTIVLSVIPTFTTGKLGFANITWFIYLYLIGSYIKKYPTEIFSKRKFYGWLAIISYLAIFMSVMGLDYLGIHFNKPSLSVHATYFTRVNKLPILICSVALFLYFKNLNLGSNKYINSMSITTFGIYLIHENNTLRDYLWHTLAQCNSYYHSSWLFLHAIITITVVYVGCMAIDYLRIYLIEKPIFSMIDRKWGDNLDYNIKRRLDRYLHRKCIEMP